MKDSLGTWEVLSSPPTTMKGRATLYNKSRPRRGARRQWNETQSTGGNAGARETERGETDDRKSECPIVPWKPGNALQRTRGREGDTIQMDRMEER
jgi:hypothetical protein